MGLNILIADCSSLAVLGARTLLEGKIGATITKAENGEDLVALGARLNPDIALLGDQFDPLFDTLELIESLLACTSRARIIVMGMLTEGLLIRDLFHAGASAYLALGDDLSECLLTAVATVMRDRPYLSPTANAEYLLTMHKQDREWKLDPEARTVLRLLTQGHTIGSIAAEMRVKPRHVYWIREKLRHRFGAETNEHLIKRAVVEGFGSFKD